MLLNLGIISILFFTNPSLANECKSFANVLICLGNKSVEVEVSPNDLTCRANLVPDQVARDDYIYTPGVGSHKLHVVAKTWNAARKICTEEGAHLAIINSKAEEEALLRILKAEQHRIRDGANQNQAFLGVHDMYEEGDWVTIFQDSLYSTGYVNWASDWINTQPDNLDGNQNCGSLVVKGGMDDVRCFEKFAFFCEQLNPCAP